ncbi:MAG: hypothetical protein GC192_07550 [Bacteroidetes bacterium]|nr:hypothetical protein [Bacteroidota bacterium]
MGVTIHYRGKLRSPTDVLSLTDELVDICKSAGWQYQVLDFTKPETVDEPFSGITFQPHPKCEPVWMLFNGRGELAHPFGYKSEDGGPPWSFTKTQFAGVEAHKAICHLFRYLEKQWFERFEVNDETSFWTTEEEQDLLEKFSYLDHALNAFTEEFGALPPTQNETLEDRVAGILQRFWERRKPPGWKPSGAGEV